VGALVVANARLLAEGFRGEIETGEHAEYTVLARKLDGGALNIERDQVSSDKGERRCCVRRQQERRRRAALTAR
jgi:hypothetical protein